MRRKLEDARRLRVNAQEMLRLASQTTMEDVAAELIKMAAVLHDRARKAEEATQLAQSPPKEKAE